MTQEDVKPSELGAYTNNIPNSRGIKKLLSDVKALFTKTGTLETAVGGKQDKLTAGTNITITEENVISASSVSKEWIEDGDYTTWGKYLTGDYTNTELLIMIGSQYFQHGTTVYTIPKGTYKYRAVVGIVIANKNAIQGALIRLGDLLINRSESSKNYFATGNDTYHMAVSKYDNTGTATINTDVSNNQIQFTLGSAITIDVGGGNIRLFIRGEPQ